MFIEMVVVVFVVAFIVGCMLVFANQTIDEKEPSTFVAVTLLTLVYAGMYPITIPMTLLYIVYELIMHYLERRVSR